MKKGDLLSVHYPYTDMQGFKRRPALVIAVETSDVTVAFITTNLGGRRQPYDVPIQPSDLNRLANPSVIRVVKLMTLDASLIYGRLGELSADELTQVNTGLRLGLGLT